MKISIKIKFSIFLVLILLSTIGVLTFMVLRGIEENQLDTIEEYLKQHTKSANIYFYQFYMKEKSNDLNDLFEKRGNVFASQLESATGMWVILYDLEGKIIGNSSSKSNLPDVSDTLFFALLNKTAYQITEDSMFYLAPLTLGNVQIGVVQFFYSLKNAHETINNTQTLFIKFGTVVFCISFLICFFYFDGFARSILKLKKMIDNIAKGNYDIPILKRDDEVGALSEGIHYMSHEIKKNIEDMADKQEKLYFAVEKLSKLEVQQKQFIGNITHEFKTPLTSIRANIDLLEMYPDDLELSSKVVERVTNDVQRLNDMIQRILHLSALDKYDFQYHKEKISIKEKLEHVISQVVGRLEKFEIILEKEITDSTIYADKESMMHILLNLLDNAIKYNQHQGRIWVKSEVLDSKVIISISNTGPGIPQEHRTKIFEPFYTVDSSRWKNKSGTGLGLTLVKEMIEKQSGIIVLKESHDNTTTFEISFPLAN